MGHRRVSHLALRRVMIRLLHAPKFAAALAADAERALAAEDLTPTERRWLAEVAPAAWHADRDRPARVLAALAEEFPLTLRLDATRAAGFFAAPEFHEAIQRRGSLALAFGAHLGRSDDPRVRALARVESAIAAIRRADQVDGTTTPGLRLSPRARVVSAPAGTLDLAVALRAAGPLGATLGPGTEVILAFAAEPGGNVTLEPLEPELAALLDLAAGGCGRAALLAAARRHGAEAGEDQEIVDRLIADGLLVGAAASAV